MNEKANLTAIDESRMMVRYYADKLHRLIKAKRACDKAGIVNSAWHPSSVTMWFREWRRERRHLADLLVTSGYDFPSHEEMLAEFAKGMREHRQGSAA